MFEQSLLYKKLSRSMQKDAVISNCTDIEMLKIIKITNEIVHFLRKNVFK